MAERCLSVPSLRFVAALLLFAGCAGSERTAGGKEPETNLSVITRLAGEVADSVVTHAGAAAGTAVILRLEPAGHWYVFDAFARALQSRGVKIVTERGGGAARIDVNVIETATAYDHSRRSWLLGSTEMDRTIRVYLRIRTEAADSLRSVETGLAFRELRDTVKAAEVPALETNGVPATQSPLPTGGWLDDFMEPIIIAGAIVVGVVLLFTVRS